MAAKRIVEENNLDIQADKLYALKYEASKFYLQSDSFPLISGTHEIMKALRERGIRLGLVSGSDRVSVMASIKAHGLDKWVEVVVTGDDVDHSKPAPDVYLKAIKTLGVAPEQCLSIEDSEAGITSSAAAGISCLAMRTEYTEHHDRSKALMEFNNFESLASWIFND